MNEPYRIALSENRCLLVCEHRRDRSYPAAAENEILVIDDRAAADPSFQIRDSYRIGRKQQREEILSALIAFAQEHPAPASAGGIWQRTVPSMEKEWLLHNIAYRAHILRSSSMHVALNNGEEEGSLRHYARRAAGLVRYVIKRLMRRTAQQ